MPDIALPSPDQMARLNEQALAEDLAHDRTALTATPLNIQLEITNDCNLACPTCARNYWNPGLNPIGHMPPDMVDRLAPFLARARSVTTFGYGESLLSPTLPDILTRVRRFAPHTRLTLVSNGVSLNEARARTLLDHGISQVYFSIDAAEPAQFRALRTASLERFRRNVTMLRTLRDARGQSDPYLAANFTATRANIDQLGPVVTFCAEVGLAAVVVIIARVFEVSQRADSLYTDADGVALAHGIIDAAREQGERCGVKIIVAADRPPGQRISCMQPFDTLFVKWNGEVRICCASAIFTRKPIYITVGNLNDGPLESLWNSPYAQEVRQGFYDPERMNPICRACPFHTVTIDTLCKFEDM